MQKIINFCIFETQKHLFNRWCRCKKKITSPMKYNTWIASPPLRDVKLAVAR